MKYSIALVLVAALSLSAAAQVQPQFSSLGKQFQSSLGRGPFPAGFAFSVSPFFVDIDSDGDLDLLEASSDWQGDRILQNDGRGTFTTGNPLPTALWMVTSNAIGDVDGDGDVDLVFATYNADWFFAAPEQNQLYLGDGAGNFTNATMQLPQVLDESFAVALGDVDGDGDLDIYFGIRDMGSGSASPKLYLNDGTGVFTDASSRMPATRDSPIAAAFGDADGDGDLDLVVANIGWNASGEQNRLYRNDGTGHFTDATSGLPQRSDESSSLVFTDLDRDGDLDLFFANLNEQNRLYRNDGNGTFVDATASIPTDQAFSSSVVAKDMDSDGDLDLVIANSGRCSFYLNDGGGVFSDGTGTRMPTHGASQIAVGDIDGDGDEDVFFETSFPNSRLYLNDGMGVLQSATAVPPVMSRSEALAFGDVDGDGDQDYISAGSSGRPGTVMKNDGSGVFRAGSSIPTSSGQEIVLCDLDGDGDLDFVLVDFLQPLRLFQNDGAGNFTDISVTHVTGGRGGFNSALAIDDVDGDGDPDIVAARGDGGGVELYLNDGGARFTHVSANQMPQIGGAAEDVVLGDVDADGDLDMVIGFPSATAPARLYLNDGTGRFSDTQANLPRHVKGVALGDVDGDGDLDLALVPCGAPAYLLLNDGQGAFTDVTAARMPARIFDGTLMCWFLAGWNAPEFVDIDEDGDSDLWIEDYGQHVLYINDGTGRFSDESARQFSTAEESGGADLALGDVDGDGDLDLLSSEGFPGDELLLNLRRHLHAPRMAVIGRAFELNIYARYSSAAQDFALPFVSAKKASIFLPQIGTVGLDPSSMIGIPGVWIPQPAGMASIQISVPKDNALVGVEIYLQALIASVPGVLRLTNVISETVLR